MNRRLPQTTMDYLVVAIAPALIIAMVVSLLWYVIALFAVPKFALNWLVFFFSIAAVLITRIAIDLDTRLASVYGSLLALATLIVFGSLSPGLILPAILLIAPAWWAVHRLTWDSTVIDESERARTTGLLQTLGLDSPAHSTTQPESSASASHSVNPPPESAQTSTPIAARNRAATTMPPAGAAEKHVPGTTDGTTLRSPSTWWQRLLANQQRHHLPGKWAFYFALLALPIFGCGQIFAADQSAAANRYRFMLIVCYLASCLGLLMGTSLLQLRKYLRQRQVAMPTEMAQGWLLGGLAMIFAVLLVSQLLPRPAAEFSTPDVVAHWIDAQNLQPSRWGLGPDGIRDHQVPGEASQPIDADQRAREPSSRTGNGEPASGQTSSSDRPQSDQAYANQSKSGEVPSESPSSDSSGSESSSSESSSSESSSSESSSSESSSSESSGSESSGSESPSSESANSESRQGGEQNRSPGSTSEPSTADGEHAQQGESGTDEPQADSGDAAPADERSERAETAADDTDNSASARPQTPPPPSTPDLFSSWAPSLGGLFKLIYWLVVLVAVGYIAWRLRDFLSEWWASLRPRSGEAEDADPPEPTLPPRPFSDFADPFATGAAARWSAVELIRYTFEAVEAWAQERGRPREAQQTPAEFTHSVLPPQHPLHRHLLHLGELYNEVAYGPQSAPPHTATWLRDLWRELR